MGRWMNLLGVDGWIDQLIDGWTDGGMDEWKERRMDELIHVGKTV